MQLNNLLPINIHLSLAACKNGNRPAFVLIDANLHAEASKFRWTTNSKPVRPIATVVENHRRTVTTLGRWVWLKHGRTVSGCIAPINHDNLDLRIENLQDVPMNKLFTLRSGQSGAAVKTCLDELGYNLETAREVFGINAEGSVGRRGVKPILTEEAVTEILEARKLCPDLDALHFNCEMVSGILGRGIHPVLLSRIIRGLSHRVESFDYSTVPSFSRKAIR